MALKIKITIHYINDTTLPVILILPSLASSPRIGVKSAGLIPAHILSLLLSILPLLLARIQRMRSRGDWVGAYLEGRAPGWPRRIPARRRWEGW